MQPPKPKAPFDFILNLDKMVKFEPIKIDTKFFASLEKIAQGIALFQANIAKIVKPLLIGFAEAFKDAEKADAVQAAGWIPHPTIPIADIKADMTSAEIDAILSEHYRANWSSVRETMSKSVAATAIDAEAKATFEEALAAHEAGLYRCVVRVLFPEIERVARETVYGGSRKELLGKGAGRKNNAGLRDLREALMSRLPVGVALGTPYALTLVQKMYEHLYTYVPEDAAGLAVFERDPVPNRHASQHGFVTYSSAQNSINMLAMADFMFHVIMRAHAYLESVTPESAKEQPADC